MVRTHTKQHLPKAAAAALLVVLGAARPVHATVQQHFNPGSLIIPMEGPFQDACGVVSAYGLVYKVLAANEALVAAGKSRITVHWVYKVGKGSPNRCVPTNLHPTPQTAATSCAFPYNDATKCKPFPFQDKIWNDGCDFTVTSKLNGAPVALLDTTSSTGALMGVAAGCSATQPGCFATRDTTIGYDAGLSYPNFGSVLVQHSATANKNVTDVQYMGGAFVINAADAPQFIQILSGSISPQLKDRFDNPIDFSTFTNKAEINKCALRGAGNSVVFGNYNPAAGNGGYAATHWVNIHKALASFDASDSQVMSAPPGKIALLQTAGGLQGSGTNGVVGDMLPNYLKSAGLDFPSAQGCSPTGYNAKKAPTNCALKTKGGTAASGYIFDAFDVMDLQDLAELNQTYFDAKLNRTRYVYQNFWTPHWEGSPFPGCDQTCINTARQNIAKVTMSRKMGLMAECGSIGVLEGSKGTNAFDPGMPGNPGLAAGWWYPPQQQVGTTGTYADPLGGYTNPMPLANAGEIPARIMTCVETTPGSGKCALNADGTVATTGTAGMRGTLHDLDPKAPASSLIAYQIIEKNPLHNCTDPDLKAGVNCMYYGFPDNAYSQVGDYLWFPRYGLVSNFKPNTGNTYQRNVGALGFAIAGVKNPGPTLTYDLARPQMSSDEVTLMQQATSTSDVLYLGGHSYSGDVAGTRVVLNTMLALGQAWSSIETGYIGATEYNGKAFVPTYERVDTDAAAGAPAQWQSFTPNMADQWRFPYHLGHFRAHDVNGSGGTSLVANKANAYTDGLVYADAKLPLPGARNVFTYLGGTVNVDATVSPAKVSQTGWTPVDIDWDSVVPGNKKCVDNFHIGEVNSKTKPNFTGTPYVGMLPGGDGVCDLQEALELTNVKAYFGADNGATNGASGGSIPTAFLSDLLNAKEFAQMVRGFCYATDSNDGSFVPHPNDDDLGKILPAKACNAYKDGLADIQNDTAELGGFVHSQAAIVPASPFIADSPTGTHRPTVAYVGGLDGQLHAFYVPSDHLDQGYQRPFLVVDPTTKANPDASSAFAGHTPFGSFTLGDSDALTELWSFIPPGQLPLLQTNNAEVDSSPVAIDVYGDFDGKGTRTWHTVLVASAGGGNREVFALDVTNPLRPVLLWDLQANFQDKLGVQFASGPLTDDDTGKNLSNQSQAFSWQNGCHSGAANCTVTDFKLPPLGKPKVTGPYNYASLGASQSISVAQMRRFNSPLFAAFVATNEPQDLDDSGNGLYVFAIDVTNGAKVWQFNNPYYTVNPELADPTADPRYTQIQGAAGNTPPAGVTLLSKAGNSLIDTAYVGDDEGSLWELDAADGVNANAMGPLLTDSQYNASCASGQRCNFALSQAWGAPPAPSGTDPFGAAGSAGPQPISSLSTVFILPTMPPGHPLKPYEGQPLLAYGTGGTDTVSGLEPAAGSSGTVITGALHLVPLLPGYRYTKVDLLTDPKAPGNMATRGVLKQEPPKYPRLLSSGERIYGSIVAAGDQLYYSTTTGSVSQIDQRDNLGGSTYRLLLSATSSDIFNYATLLSSPNVGGAGGTPMLDTTTGTLVVVTDKKILRFNAPTGGTRIGPTVNGRGATPTGLLSWFFRRRGLEY